MECNSKGGLEIGGKKLPRGEKPGGGGPPGGKNEGEKIEGAHASPEKKSRERFFFLKRTEKTMESGRGSCAGADLKWSIGIWRQKCVISVACQDQLG